MKYYDEKHNKIFDTLQEYEAFQKEKENERLKKEALNAEYESRMAEITDKVRQRDEVQKEINCLLKKYYNDYRTELIINSRYDTLKEIENVINNSFRISW